MTRPYPAPKLPDNFLEPVRIVIKDRLFPSWAAGQTIGNVILIRRDMLGAYHPSLRLLIAHELVHVWQYRKLGILGFLYNYVRTWLRDGRKYSFIDAEEEAFYLQGHEVFLDLAESLMAREGLGNHANQEEHG